MKDKQRLDHYLSKTYPDVSRGFLQKLINDGQVLVNGESEKSGFKLHRDDNVKMLYDMTKLGKVPDIELSVLYEDADVMVVNKAPGILSHALTKFYNEPSVASFLRQRMKDLKTDDHRFGIVHRLDRATSGVMICAKNHETLSDLQQQFGARTVEKTYVALVKGSPKLEAATIDVPLERNPKAPATYRPGNNGRAALTQYKVIQSNNGYSLIKLHPKTGRTHQLRVHMNHIGHPIVGDVLYDGEPAERLYLHATELTLKLRNKKKQFVSPVPDEFLKRLNKA